MLNKLFRPKWQHENPEIRKAAIAKLGNNDTTILEQLAISDENTAVRQAATARIEDLATLERLITQAKTSTEQELAQKCWVYTLTESGKYSALEAEQTIIECTNEKLLGAIIAYSENSCLRELALGGITSESSLLSLMEDTRHARIWQTISEKLSSEDALKKALAIVNGRDKRSQHTLKEKLENIRKHQQFLQQKSAQAEQLANRLQHLLGSESNPLFEGILLTAKQQLQTISNDINKDKNDLIASLIHDCEQRLHLEQQKKMETLYAKEKEEKEFAQQLALLQDLQELVATAQTLEAKTPDIENGLNTISQQWQSLNSPERLQKKYHTYSSTITSLLGARLRLNEAGIDHLDQTRIAEAGFGQTQQWLKDSQSALELLKKAGIDQNSGLAGFTHQVIADLEKHSLSLKEAGKQLHRNIKQDFADAEALVEKQDLKNAQRIFARIRQSIEKLPEHDARSYANHSQRLFHAIKNLEDWKNFASDEKRNELCERMQKLSETDMDLPAKAEHIKALQQEWKSLGHCHDQKLWEKFKGIADTAYAPCQEYFNREREKRKFNAEQCQIICEQLEALLANQDWDNTDWKNIEHLYKAVHDEWKKYSLLTHEDYRLLHDRFYKSINILKEKLNNERRRNHDKLDSLIHQAKQLLTSTDMQQALIEYSNLQQQWKNTGLTFHKEQQQQWHAFRKAGDALYEQRQSLRNEAEHERQANLASANMIISEIASMATLNDEELAASRNHYLQLKAGFKALTSLPKEDFKSCLQAFNNACDSYDQHWASIGKRQLQKQLASLKEIANQWCAAECRGENPDIEQAGAALPAKWLNRLATRTKQTPAASAADDARLLCIEMETLGGVTTPEADMALRMQWQMNKLAKNFGHAQLVSPVQELEDLYLRWYAMPCWNEQEYVQLQQRFLHAAQSAIEKILPA